MRLVSHATLYSTLHYTYLALHWDITAYRQYQNLVALGLHHITIHSFEINLGAEFYYFKLKFTEAKNMHCVNIKYCDMMRLP